MLLRRNILILRMMHEELIVDEVEADVHDE
jgi:hypothetical protein